MGARGDHKLSIKNGSTKINPPTPQAISFYLPFARAKISKCSNHKYEELHKYLFILKSIWLLLTTWFIAMIYSLRLLPFDQYDFFIILLFTSSSQLIIYSPQVVIFDKLFKQDQPTANLFRIINTLQICAFLMNQKLYKIYK